MAILLAMLAGGCDTNNSSGKDDTIVVNSLADVEQPDPGVTTLRSALAQADAGQTIGFDESPAWVLRYWAKMPGRRYTRPAP